MDHGDGAPHPWNGRGETEAHGSPRSQGAADGAGMAASSKDVVRPPCPYCRSGEAVRWGRTRVGWQRLRCRRCHRTYAETTATLLAGIHHPERFRRLTVDMLEGPRRSCRRLAEALDLDRTTIWRWRQKVMSLLAEEEARRGAKVLGGIVTGVRESRKASRAWVRHERDPARYPAPDRPRWWEVERLGLPVPGGPARFRILLRLGIDTAGHRRAERMPRECRDARSAADPASPTPASLPSATGTTQAQPSSSPRASATPTAADAAQQTLRPGFHAFLRPFCGPATRYLEGYAAWFGSAAVDTATARLDALWQALRRPRQHDLPTYPTARWRSSAASG